jgi:hypothetical protein
MRLTIAAALVLAGVGLALLGGWPPAGFAAREGASAPPAAIAAAARGAAAAAAAPAPASAAASVCRVRVVVRLPAGIAAPSPPVPELLRVDHRGATSPVSAVGARPEPSLLELARGAAAGRGAAEASRSFEVAAPGRYQAAWHLWLPVPGTSTWRVRRGRGPEVHVSGAEAEREIAVSLGVGDLALDPAIDAREPGARYTFTAKDGD